MNIELVIFGFVGTTVIDDGVVAGPFRETVGASRALSQLRQGGIKTAIVTDLSIPAAGAIDEALGWRARRLVDVFVTSDEVERGAPEPDAVFEVMQRAGVRESARVAFVSNATSELQQATAAGCGLVVGVFDSDGSFGRVRAAPHNVLLPACALVPELLRRISARRIAPIAMGWSS